MERPTTGDQHRRHPRAMLAKRPLRSPVKQITARRGPTDAFPWEKYFGLG